MKNLMIGLLATAFLAVACGKKENETTESTVTSASTADGSNVGQDSTGIAPALSGSESATKDAAGFSTNGIIAAYLKLQDALTRDDAKAAAQAGKMLYGEFAKVDSSVIDQKKRADYLDIAADAKEHAEHISNNASDISHQREHLAVLSTDISDLVEAFGSDTKLYQDHCPMYNGGKGAIWVSASKEIRNPYYGTDMLSCGSVKKEF